MYTLTKQLQHYSSGHEVNILIKNLHEAFSNSEAYLDLEVFLMPPDLDRASTPRTRTHSKTSSIPKDTQSPKIDLQDQAQCIIFRLWQIRPTWPLFTLKQNFRKHLVFT